MDDVMPHQRQTRACVYKHPQTTKNPCIEHLIPLLLSFHTFLPHSTSDSINPWFKTSGSIVAGIERLQDPNQDPNQIPKTVGYPKDTSKTKRFVDMPNHIE